MSEHDEETKGGVKRHRSEMNNFKTEGVPFGSSGGGSSSSGGTSFGESSNRAASSSSSTSSSTTSSAPLDPFRFCNPVDPAIASRIAKTIASIIYQRPDASYKQNELPGPLPHTMGRSTIPALKQAAYWVCEKSDGQRVMMFVCKDGAFLADRKFTLRRISNDDTYIKYLGQPGKETLVDGELIENAGTNAENTPENPGVWKTEPTLMLFDAVMVKGEYVGAQALPIRLRSAGDVKRSFVEGADTLVMKVQTKRFTAAKRLDDVSDLIKLFPTQGHFVYDDRKEKKLMSLNDGIIFTPDQNDYLHTNGNLPIYKFKWAGLNTVDFSLEHPFFNEKNELKLNISVGRGQTVFCRASKMPEDERKRLVCIVAV